MALSHRRLAMPQLIASVEGVEIKHVHLTQDRTTLGRKADNDIVLDNLVVSSRHCVFELKGLADVYLEDLRSTNGTFVNNKRVTSQQKLQDGDVIAIGNFRIQYVQSSPDPSGFYETAAFRAEGPGTGLMHASFKVLNGSSEGLEMPVVKAVTTFGKPGVAIVAVSHRRTGYYVAHLDGPTPSTLNGDAIGPTAVQLSNHDVLELAGTRMLFQLTED